MKNPLFALLLAGGAAFAGSPSKDIIQPAPAAGGVWSWFAGAGIGYLFDYEEEMYHGHVGVDTPWNWGGWRSAFFLEVGHAETEDSVWVNDPTFGNGNNPLPVRPRGTPGGGGGPVGPVTVPFASEFSMVPVTLNFKLEREIANHLNFYFGAGLGVAFTSFDGYADFARVPDLYTSSDDEVFCAQVFTGLGYDVTEAFEVYGGFRWIYLDDTSVAGAPATGIAQFEDDFLGELGLRFNF
jgi:opacity protein-like surface antigen